MSSSSLSSITNILRAEAHEFSPLSILKLEAARISSEKKGVHNELWKKLQSHEIQRLSRDSVKEYCRFCKSNGEKVEDYSSHVTKDRDGVVQCPVLRNYVCPK